MVLLLEQTVTRIRSFHSYKVPSYIKYVFIVEIISYRQNNSMS